MVEKRSEEPAALPRRRGRPRSTQAHQAVLDATTCLLAECGVAATSVDEIAARAQVSKATIYKHWSSKEELCLEAIRRLRSDEPVTTSGDVRTEVLTLIEDILHPPAQSLDLRILAHLLGEMIDDPKLARAWRESVMLPRRRRLAATLQRGIAQGQLLATMDVELAIDLLLGPIFYRRLVTGNTENVDAFAQSLVESLWQLFGTQKNTGGSF